jgi:signal transduction histidine kinase
VSPRLLEIDGIYRRMEEACASADGESGEVLGAIGPIKNGIGKGLVLAQQFLEYSKMQEIRRGAGQIDLAALVKAVIGEVAVSLEVAGVSCETQIEGEDFKLRGDYGQLESVVKNLVLNAKDALQDSAEKRLTLRLSRFEKNGVPCIRLVVADTGTGIPAEAREKIFRPFYTTKPATGTGLGLSVVKRIVEAYEGEIDFKSPPGGGTEFVVEISV